MRTAALVLAGLLLGPVASALVSLPVAGCELLGPSPLDDCALWEATLAGSGHDDRATAVVASPDGSAVFVAYTLTTASGSHTDIGVSALDAEDGALLWTYAYDGAGTTNDLDAAEAIAITPDGATVLVTGMASEGVDGYDITTIALAATSGAVVWTQSYAGNGDPQDWDNPEDVTVSPDGSVVIVTGWSYGPRASTGISQSYDWMTLAYDAATGASLWQARLHMEQDSVDKALDADISADGTLLAVTGWTQVYTGNPGVQYTTAVYDMATGAEAWRAHYNGNGSYADRAAAVAISPDASTVYVTGESYHPTTLDDYATVAYDAATGAQLWASRYNGTGAGSDPRRSGAEGIDLVVSPDGGTLYVTGESTGETNASAAMDFVTLALDTTDGSRIWLAEYESPLFAGVDRPTQMALTSDGADLLVTGRSYANRSPWNATWSTVAYDAATGAESWRLLHNGTTGSPNARVAGIALSADDAVAYVAGDWNMGSGVDVGVAAYWITPPAAVIPDLGP